MKAWGPRGLHSGKMVPDQVGFKRLPLDGGAGNGQERECSRCAHVHVRKVTHRDQATLKGHEGNQHGPKQLDSLPGESRPPYGVSSQEEENVAKQPLNTRTSQEES